MKKGIRRGIVKGVFFALVFFAAVILIGRIMNEGNQDMTAEMAPAGFPVVYMGMDGVRYNELHGYAQPMNTAYMRDTITVLNEGRTTEFYIDTFGEKITDISYELRSVDGERLIEDTVVSEYEMQGSTIYGTITVKDLIEQNREYELIMVLQMRNGNSARYYTRLVWSTDYHVPEKLSFAMDFQQKTFDREKVRELAKYMETNAEGDNSTLHYVNIHCSLQQVAWGNLEVEQATEPVFNVTELAAETASITSHYLVSSGTGSEKKYFYVEEYYRLRYTPDRMYLLDYTRTMNSLLDEKGDIYVNDKILLGVEDENLPIFESEDGNVFAFEVQNRLYSYNMTTNKIAVIFGFYDAANADARTLHNQHGIKVLDIDEGGNVAFAVYGYMNRGRHEGEVGVQICFFDSAHNTVEEVLYIPYDKTYQILKEEIEQVLYMSRENYLYLMFANEIYEINLNEKTYTPIFEVEQDDSMRASKNNKMLVWQSGGGLYDSTALVLMNLGTREQMRISASAGEYIMPLGFMGEDLIYGVARAEELVVDEAGRTTFPMYAVYIQDASGTLLKSYRQENVYVSGCEIGNNQITLERLVRLENGTLAPTASDNIMSSEEAQEGKNTIKPVVTENYGKYIQIAVRQEIDAKSLQVLTPKEILYEGVRTLELCEENPVDRYYVYGPDGVAGIYHSPARAVILAEEKAGVVVDDEGGYVWIRGNRALKNQIMAIEAASATEERSSLAVCLDTVLKYEGVVRNSDYLLSQGQTAYSILEGNLEGARILDLKGCSLDAVLYYLNRDIPVLASLNDGGAVLLIGFNQYNVVVMDPERGSIYKMGMHDSAQWFEQNGNSFITYIK